MPDLKARIASVMFLSDLALSRSISSGSSSQAFLIRLSRALASISVSAQAGLSWETILKKQDNFRKAYSQFNIKKVSAYKEADFKRLMADAGIIRNRLKVNAAIENAKAIG